MRKNNRRQRRPIMSEIERRIGKTEEYDLSKIDYTNAHKRLCDEI